MKKSICVALVLAAVAPVPSDAWVAFGGRGGFVAAGGPCWHPGWGCGGVCTGTAVAAGVAGFAAGAAVGAALARPAVVVTPAPVVVNQVQFPPAVGAIYYSLPYGAQALTVGGQQYYLLGGTYYRPFFGNNGVYYEVVAPPI